jgi:hypothetical protein
MCDVKTEQVNYTPLLSSILDISSLLYGAAPVANQMNNVPSTLYAPKPCHISALDNTQTPSTVGHSPNVLKPLADITFSSALKLSAMVPQVAPVGHHPFLH